jgi:hypothetical protein
MTIIRKPIPITIDCGDHSLGEVDAVWTDDAGQWRLDLDGLSVVIRELERVVRRHYQPTDADMEQAARDAAIERGCRHAAE